MAGKGTQAASGWVRVFAEWKDQLKTESNKKCRGVDTFITIKEGRGGGLVVSVLAFYSDYPSSIPALAT